MSAVVADTHSIIWYLTAPENLSDPAQAALEQAEAAEEAIYVATITIVEVIYLVEKGRLTAAVLALLLQALQDPNSVVTAVPLDYNVA